MVVLRQSIGGEQSTSTARVAALWRGITCASAALMLAASATHAVSQEKPQPPQPPTATAIATPLVVAPAPPATSAPAGGDKPAEKLADKPAENLPEKPKSIALILPISSKSLGKAAEAARAGFLAGAAQSTKTPFEARLYLADDEAGSLASLYRKAMTDGAVAVVAGLTRDGATVVAREAGYLPTLALNTPADLAKADANNFFHLSLNVDWDARVAARAASDEGFRSVAIVHSNAALARRIQDAFEKEWLKLGGVVATRIAFSGDLHDGPKVKAAMEKPDAARADVAFIAADMAVARFVRPFLPQGMPVFATAQTFDPRAGALENLDLDSVKYPEMPWFVERDHPAVMTYARPLEEMPAEYERLYALGIDAWRIIFALVSPPSPTAVARSNAKQPFAPIDGVTGRITLDGNQFLRGLPIVEMRDGKPQVTKSVE